VIEEVAVPSTVKRKLPLTMPVPVSGTVVGDEGSEFVRVSVPERGPVAVGLKVTVARQVAAGTRVVGQGVVTA